MEELFERISKEENCKYDVVYEKAYAPYIFLPLVMKENGLQIKSISLQVPYKSQFINIKYELSNNHFGTLNCELNIDLQLPKFQIVKRNPFARILNKKINTLKINCNENKFIDFLQEKLMSLEIEETARKYQFEPEITGKISHGNYEIICSYHLAFQEKKNILRPMILFYKCLIDYSIEKNS